MYIKSMDEKAIEFLARIQEIAGNPDSVHYAPRLWVAIEENQEWLNAELIDLLRGN